MLEFAFIFPVVILMSLTGAELTNYVTTRMRASQMALQLADNAARMGKGTQITDKVISETDINDIFTGVQLQSGELNIQANGRVILSDLEPMANPNTSGRYKIVWQRCFGSRVHPSTYGNAGDTNLTGIGPAGRQAVAQPDNATMFVEVYYVYKPLVGLGNIFQSNGVTEIASMAVRDRRDLSQIYNNEHATPSTC